MLDLLESPLVLLLALPLGIFLFRYCALQGTSWKDKRWRYRLIFKSLTFIALLLALAGLRWPGARRTVQVVAAVDVSASVYDKAVVQSALNEGAAIFAPVQPEIAVLGFGRETTPLRPLAKLPFSGKVVPREREAPPADAAQSPWPNLPQAAVVLDGSASDYATALDRARGLLLAESSSTVRAVLLIGDGFDTEGRAQSAAAAFAGSGVDLLAWPVELSGGSDVHLAGLDLPEHAQVGRAMGIEVSVAAREPMEAHVIVERWNGVRWEHVKSVQARLTRSADRNAGAVRATVRITDAPQAPGVVTYRARVEPAEGLANFRENDVLYGAVRVAGSRTWAVLARPGSTLAGWAAHPSKPLGVETKLFLSPHFPTHAAEYADCAGVLVDGFSADEWPADGAALKVLATAMTNGAAVAGVRGGMGLVTVGGETAYGAGKHPSGGTWEMLLPVTFRPEDDRTRTVLFLVDISMSMNVKVDTGDTKLAYARSQLGQVVRGDLHEPVLQASDRLGLIAFSGPARVVAPPVDDPARTAFTSAFEKLTCEANTDLRAVLRQAREVLAEDTSEERLVVLLSDGEDTTGATDEQLLEEVKLLCPPPEAGLDRRTGLYCFGIGTGTQHVNSSGEETLRKLAQAGGGQFVAEFLKLAERLKQVFEERRKDLYVRHEDFSVQPLLPHAVLAAAGSVWPRLPFRNRVKARPSATLLAQSAALQGAESAKGGRKPDPLLVLGRLGASRTAALSLALEGKPGQAFLTSQGEWKGGQALLAALLSWAECRDAGAAGWRIETTPTPAGHVAVELFAEDPSSAAPVNELHLTARLEPLNQTLELHPTSAGAPPAVQLLPIAPGRYKSELLTSGTGVYRLEIKEARGATAERFVSVPYPPEYQRFGVDRNAMQDLADRAGGRSRIINLPRTDLVQWLQEQETLRAYTSLKPYLLVLAMVFFLCEIAARGMRLRK